MFLGRKEKLSEIKKLYETEGFKIIVLYGRLRVVFLDYSFENKMSAYVGYIFEDACRKYLIHKNREVKICFVQIAAQSYRQTPKSAATAAQPLLKFSNGFWDITWTPCFAEGATKNCL